MQTGNCVIRDNIAVNGTQLRQNRGHCFNWNNYSKLYVQRHGSNQDISETRRRDGTTLPATGQHCGKHDNIASNRTVHWYVKRAAGIRGHCVRRDNIAAKRRGTVWMNMAEARGRSNDGQTMLERGAKRLLTPHV